MTAKTPKASEAQEALELGAERKRSLRARNLALGAAVGLFVVLFYVVTIVKLSAVAHPPA